MTARRRATMALLAGSALLAGCGNGDAGESGTVETSGTAGRTPPTVAPDASAGEQRHPDVIGAEATLADDGTWTISATLSSPYDTPERYADAWRVVGPDGVEYGVRVLTHDHADEQRSSAAGPASRSPTTSTWSPSKGEIWCTAGVAPRSSCTSPIAEAVSATVDSRVFAARVDHRVDRARARRYRFAR